MPWLSFKSKNGFSKHWSLYNCTSYVKSRAMSEKIRSPYCIVFRFLLMISSQFYLSSSSAWKCNLSWVWNEILKSMSIVCIEGWDSRGVENREVQHSRIWKLNWAADPKLLANLERVSSGLLAKLLKMHWELSQGVETNCAKSTRSVLVSFRPEKRGAKKFKSSEFYTLGTVGSNCD